jgi:hypothetical protein
MMKLLLVLSGALPALAVAQTIMCPESIPETSIGATRAPPGWVATSPTIVRLDGGGMLSGDPKQLGYLVPAASKKVKGGEASTWHFEPGEEKWLFCTYGKMAVQLSKRMDDKATTCEITAKLERKDVITSIAAVCR